jgi:hypothetical protein
MRGLRCSSTIGSDVLHPSVHLELSGERPGRGAVVEMSYALTAANHFAHRETDDIVVDLFWSPRGRQEFRVEVEDRREQVRFVLYPRTGKDAIAFFYHPFAGGGALYGEAEAAS